MTRVLMVTTLLLVLSGVVHVRAQQLDGPQQAAGMRSTSAGVSAVLAPAGPAVRPAPSLYAATSLFAAPVHAAAPLYTAAPASPALAAATRVAGMQDRGTHRMTGALVGFVVGAGVTYLVLRQGGSTAPCDQSANQDALRPIECAGAAALGGVVGAGIGFVIGGQIRR